MKDRNQGFSFLEEPTLAQAIKKNYTEMHGNACQCGHCFREFEAQVVFHIATAPVKEQKFITKEQLMEDMRQIQARNRAIEIFTPIQKHGKKSN